MWFQAKVSNDLQLAPSFNSLSRSGHVANSPKIPQRPSRAKRKMVGTIRTIRSYDALNRLTSISQQSANAGNAVAPKLATFAYDIASQMTDVRRYSATSVDTASLELHSRYLYDLAGRVTSITHAKTEIAPNHGWLGTATLPSSLTAPNVVAAYSLKYDRDNRLTSFGSYADRFTTAYSYNATDELTAATSTAIAGLTAPSLLPPSQSLGVDLNGNRTSSTGASQSASGTHNQLQSDAQFSYTYDHEGNLTRKTSLTTGAVTDFTWDHRNRLISVTERPTVGGAMTKQSIYAYDAFNRRTVDRLNRDGIGGIDQADYWVFDGQHAMMQIRDSDGTGSAQGYRIANRYLHGAAVDQVLSDEQYSNGAGPLVSATVSSSTPGTTYWTATDHLGSVRDVIDNNGVTRQHVVYDSFGNRSSEVDRNAAGTVIASTDAAAIDTIFGYTGRDWDKDTGLQNNRARWYDPTTGRWLSQDPIGFEAGDANLYRYVENRPSTKTDPSGLEERPYIIAPDGTPYHLSPYLPYPPDAISPPKDARPPVNAPSISQASSIYYETWQQRALRKGYSAWEIIMVQTCMPGGGFDQAVTAVGSGLPGSPIAIAGGVRPYIKPVTPAQTTGQLIAPKGPTTPTYSPLGPDGNKLSLPKGPHGQLAPSSEYPHTQIGWYNGRKGGYVQTLEFGPNGKPIKRIDWTDHGRPREHTNPHCHDYLPNPTGGNHVQGPARPLTPGERGE
jgi:RHS repeat-associated protein